MFYYITVDGLGKITRTTKSITELSDDPSLIHVEEVVDIHNSEGKEYFYDKVKGDIYFKYDLERLKVIAWEKCKKYESDVLQQGFSYNGAVYDTDEAARMAILNARLANIDVNWTTYNNEITFFTAAQFSDFHKSLTEWIAARHSNLQMIRNQINDASSISKVESILSDFTDVTSH